MAIVTITLTDKENGEVGMQATSFPKPKEGEGLTVAQYMGNCLTGLLREGKLLEHMPEVEKVEG